MKVKSMLQLSTENVKENKKVSSISFQADIIVNVKQKVCRNLRNIKLATRVKKYEKLSQN